MSTSRALSLLAVVASLCVRVGAAGCDNAREFTCQYDNRCIPIEAKCDFNEQCIDGQDELGCAPEFCDFEQDFCNWRNDLNFKFPGAKAPAPPERTPEVRRSRELWRRYFVPTGGQLLEAGENGYRPLRQIRTDGGEGNGVKAAGGTPIGGQLRELSANHKHGGKFLYVPLLLNPSKRQASEIVHAQDGTQSRKAKPANLASSTSPISVAKSASISSPLIGQTRSMCQLRFRYALAIAPFASPNWRPKSQNESNPIGADGKQATRLTLNLWGHGRSSIKRFSGSGGGGGGKPAKLLWTRSVDSSQLAMQSSGSSLAGQQRQGGGRAGRDGGPPNRGLSNIGQSGRRDSAAGADWSIGVVELGRIRQVQLSFEAAAVATSQGPAETRTKASDKTSGPELVSCLVALDWLEFHNCEWPRETRPGNAHSQPDDSLGAELDDQFDFYDWTTCSDSECASAALTSATSPRTPGSQRTHLEGGRCGPREFQCSNDICVDERRLCNFVDDCMTLDVGVGVDVVGQSAPDDTRGAAPAGRVSREVEDEAGLLCQPIPGMENFEQLDLGQLPALPGERRADQSSFWSLASDWPADKIEIRQAAGATAKYLPQYDHTSGTTGGSFLSLAIPERSRRVKGAKETHWVYLRSPWMKKLEAQSGECRVKFFFNLVTNNSQDSDPVERLPFKVYMLVDHFVASKLEPSLGGEEKQCAKNKTTRRKVDSIILSHAVDYDKLILDGELGIIEFPGIDFWREANINLLGLEEGDLFQIRVAVVVVLEAIGADGARHSSEGDNTKATINFDDMSTHFGCSLADGLDYHERARTIAAERLSSRLTLGDIIRPASDSGSSYLRLPPRRSRFDLHAIQVEPQKLVMYVFGVLSAIIGVILAIVFVLVPYVERITMDYQDRISLELNGAYDIAQQQPVAQNSFDARSSSDWEELSRQGSRPASSQLTLEAPESAGQSPGRRVKFCDPSDLPDTTTTSLNEDEHELI